MQRYYEAIREMHEEWEEKFKSFIESLKGKEMCVILFGSKAKGEDNLLSDFDLMIITKDKEDLALKNEVKYVVKRCGLIRCDDAWLVKAVV